MPGMGLCSCFCFWLAEEAGAAGGPACARLWVSPRGASQDLARCSRGTGLCSEADKALECRVCGLEFSLGPLFLIVRR